MVKHILEAIRRVFDKSARLDHALKTTSVKSTPIRKDVPHAAT